MLSLKITLLILNFNTKCLINCMTRLDLELCLLITLTIERLSIWNRTFFLYNFVPHTSIAIIMGINSSNMISFMISWAFQCIDHNRKTQCSWKKGLQPNWFATALSVKILTLKNPSTLVQEKSNPTKVFFKTSTTRQGHS